MLIVYACDLGASVTIHPLSTALIHESSHSKKILQESITMTETQIDRELPSWSLTTEKGEVWMTIRRKDGWHIHVPLGGDREVLERFSEFARTGASADA